MRRFLISVLALSASTAVSAQAIPDSTEPWAYFPLGVGDEWHYQVEQNYHYFCAPCRYQMTREVLRLETIEGVQYAVVEVRSLNVPVMPSPPPSSEMQWVRFDTSAATPIALKAFAGEYPLWTDGCRLDEPFPVHPDSTNTIVCPDPWQGEVRGGYDEPLPIGGTGVVKSIRRTYVTLEHISTFAAGIGLLRRYHSNEIDEDVGDSLVYAHVAGVEYGTPIVATEPSPPAGGVSLRVSPNPASDRVVVALVTDVAGRARLAIHDLLGREVLVAHDGWLGAGANRVMFDATGLPAGLYAIRAAAYGEIGSALLVVR